MAGLSPLYITKHSGAQSAPLWQGPLAAPLRRGWGRKPAFQSSFASDQRKDLRQSLLGVSFHFCQINVRLSNTASFPLLIVQYQIVNTNNKSTHSRCPGSVSPLEPGVLFLHACSCSAPRNVRAGWQKLSAWELFARPASPAVLQPRPVSLISILGSDVPLRNFPFSRNSQRSLTLLNLTSW